MASLGTWNLVIKLGTAYRQQKPKVFRDLLLPELCHIHYGLWWTESKGLGWVTLPVSEALTCHVGREKWEAMRNGINRRPCFYTGMEGQSWPLVMRERKHGQCNIWTEQAYLLVENEWMVPFQTELQLREINKNRTTCFSKIKGRKKLFKIALHLLPNKERILLEHRICCALISRDC